MGPENMKEGEYYIAVLQKDGTFGEWQKWEGVKKVELTKELSIRESINSLSDLQKHILDHLLGLIFKNGTLYFKDKLYYYALTNSLNETQKEAVDILIGAARKDWESKHE